jgi:GGDEF domain-containing protein
LQFQGRFGAPFILQERRAVFCSNISCRIFMIGRLGGEEFACIIPARRGDRDSAGCD